MVRENTQKMEEELIKLHSSWESRGNMLFLESMPGYFDTSKWGREEDFKDRRFMIRINDSERFAFSHDMQLALLESVLMNDALPHRFIQNCEKFLHKIHEMKGKRKELERKKYNIELSNYISHKPLWPNCGGLNGNT